MSDGAVLPILHLNGYKISNPTVLARITREELEQLLRGYGWSPHFVEGHEPDPMHQAMATTLDTAIEEIKKIQQDARVHGNLTRPRWPMIVLSSPKGWTGPKVVDGLQIEGTFRAHQVPLSDPATHPEHLEATNRQWDAATNPNDEWLAPAGRVLTGPQVHVPGFLRTNRPFELEPKKARGLGFQQPRTRHLISNAGPRTCVALSGRVLSLIAEGRVGPWPSSSSATWKTRSCWR